MNAGESRQVHRVAPGTVEGDMNLHAVVSRPQPVDVSRQCAERTRGEPRGFDASLHEPLSHGGRSTHGEEVVLGRRTAPIGSSDDLQVRGRMRFEPGHDRPQREECGVIELV
jgi:hypothetical protein